MSNGILTISEALQGATSEDPVAAVAEAQSSYSNFVVLMNSDPLANINSNSLLHSEVEFLRSEDPLQ
jgi:hypothetical protein